jgi:hypothetical protein
MTPIEVITTSIGYGDLLRQVAQYNRPLVDRWVVLTTPADTETRETCREFSIECVTTDENTRDGAFSKGRLIDRGLSLIRGDGWMMHLDCDIALPHDFHQVIEEAHLDTSCIYGCDRLNVNGYENWLKIKQEGLWCRRNPWAVDLERPGTTMGTRVANNGHGWCPLGFLQLFHSDSMNWRSFASKRYPKFHGSAARTDIQMGILFDRRKRVLIPELLVWHLDSEVDPKMGANWSGRSTRRFGPERAIQSPKPYCE